MVSNPLLFGLQKYIQSIAVLSQSGSKVLKGGEKHDDSSPKYVQSVYEKLYWG